MSDPLLERSVIGAIHFLYIPDISEKLWQNRGMRDSGLILGRQSTSCTIFVKKAKEIARPINQSPRNLAFLLSLIHFAPWFSIES
jgi:hypothetical protein